MLSLKNTFKSVHKRQILSSDIDYYDRYVCTSSADGVIQIIDTVDPAQGNTKKLREHVGPVWQVKFSHPKYGYLASCGSDCKLIIRKTNKLNEWEVIYKYDGHKSPTTSIDWASYKAGAIIACSSADGTISIHTQNNKYWSVSKIPNAHLNGVNSISWASQLINNHLSLVSGGNDSKIKIWQHHTFMWNVLYESENQLATIKDVSWCPTPGLQKHVIASCTSDGRVVIWGSDDCCDWTQTEIDATEKQKQKISWSCFGNILSVSMEDYFVTLWKQVDKKNWMCLDRKITNKPVNSERLSKTTYQDIFASII